MSQQQEALTAEEVYAFAQEAESEVATLEVRILRMLAVYADQQNSPRQILGAEDDDRLVIRMTNLSTALRMARRLALEVAITINPGIDTEEW